jgi:ATP-binding protein involved in chromosome partitioning
MHARIAAALEQVVNPRTAENVVASGMVRDVGLTRDGKVRFSILLDARDPASLVRDARQAVEKVDGVTEVRVDVKDPSEPRAPPAKAAAPPAAPAGRSLPVMGQEPQSRKAAVPAPTPVAFPHLGRILAISSGKGGVGKSTVSVNIAVALAKMGARVGLLDADIYGPNVPRMMGVDGPMPASEGGNQIVPHDAHGVKLVSLGFIIERDQPAIWRGPIVMKIIAQFVGEVAWGELDWLIVDLPPGTGDAQLALVQTTHVHGAVIVTTPQPMSTGDALRGAKMFQRVGVPVLGIVENMSYFLCPHCGKPTSLFGSGGGKSLADELELPLLGEVPLAPSVREGGDAGVPIVVSDPNSAVAKALTAIAQRLVQMVPAPARA